MRQFCLLCGRMAKQQGPGGSTAAANAFYSISTELLPPTVLTNHVDGGPEPGATVSIGQRLREILRVELPKKKLVPSEEICKKCFRQLNEVDYLEAQVNSR